MEMKLPKYSPINSGLTDSYSAGLEYQDYICYELSKKGIVIQNYGSKKYQYLYGENVQGAEIKLDQRFEDFGHLSIEIAEKTNGLNNNWIPSGIYRADNSWLYIQGNYNKFWIFTKAVLITCHKSKLFREAESPKVNPTIRKYYLPLSDCNSFGKLFIIKG